MSTSSIDLARRLCRRHFACGNCTRSYGGSECRISVTASDLVREWRIEGIGFGGGPLRFSG